ncbi:hypothetical protein GCM10023329_26350 [Streptomyces sanyensis]|uniref:Uncharacterized protein n=1 Tax=Streptomyces sanyensis TaxID=568869 RepID=A0ABP9A933_9ACTN
MAASKNRPASLLSLIAEPFPKVVSRVVRAGAVTGIVLRLREGVCAADHGEVWTIALSIERGRPGGAEPARGRAPTPCDAVSPRARHGCRRDAQELRPGPCTTFPRHSIEGHVCPD